MAALTENLNFVNSFNSHVLIMGDISIDFFRLSATPLLKDAYLHVECVSVCRQMLLKF